MEIDLLPILVIILLLVVLIVYILLRYFQQRMQQIKKEAEMYHPPVSPDSKQQDALDQPTDFEKMTMMIQDSFRPTAIETEQQAEEQLLSFLNKKLPGRCISKGQTTHGRRIDMVFEGTFGIELVLVTNEGKLVSLLQQIPSLKQKYSRLLLILVDINALSSFTIDDYKQQFEDLGISTIIK